MTVDLSEEEEEESEQIMAKFKDRPGKKSEKKKMQEMVKQRALEPWINLNFVPHGQYYSRVNYIKFNEHFYNTKHTCLLY